MSRFSNNKKKTEEIQRSNTGILRRRSLFTTILLIAAAVCILCGLFRGEAAVVLKQAVNICFACIGLG